MPARLKLLKDKRRAISSQMMEAAYTISPCALKGQGRVKELIDAMPEEDRAKALAFLLQAKKQA